MRRIDWPTAFAIVFGAVPLAVFLVAVLVAFPVQTLSFSGGAAIFWTCERIGRRRAAVAERAALAYPRNAAIVAQPLPDLPTIPMRRSA